jgi:hypothetical protein
MFGLNETAVVYTPNGTTGAYTVVAKASLRCRLANVRQEGKGAAEERDEVAQNRRLLWAEAYVMPANAQIAVGGARWNIVPNSYAEMKGLGDVVHYRRCELAVV